MERKKCRVYGTFIQRAVNIANTKIAKSRLRDLRPFERFL